MLYLQNVLLNTAGTPLVKFLNHCVYFLRRQERKDPFLILKCLLEDWANQTYQKKSKQDHLIISGDLQTDTV